MSTVLLTDEETAVKRTAAAAAAAAARKRRRKALAKRRSMSPQKLRRTDEPVAVIPPTLTGIQEVAKRWCAGEAVAFPTECTYEVAMRVPPSGVSSWNEEETTGASSSASNLQIRVQDLLLRREPRGSSSSSPARRLVLPSLTPHVYVSGGLHKASSVTAYLKRQLPERKYAYRKDGSVVSLHVFSESIQVLRRLSAKLWPGPVLLHVAVGVQRNGAGASSSSSTSTSSSCGSAAAITPSRPSSVTTHASSGSPALTPVALPAAMHSSTSSLSLSLSSAPPSPPPSPPSTPTLVAAGHAHGHGSQAPQFLALRCPCHPLAVKVSHEFYRSRGSGSGSGSSEGGGGDLLVGYALLDRPVPRRRRDDDDDDEEEEGDDDDEVPAGDANRSKRNHDGGVNEEKGRPAYVVRAGDVCRSSRRLAGEEAPCSPSPSYPSSSNVRGDVSAFKVDAVLHGEQALELFHVPPCEHGQPYGVSVWIDEGNRRIVLRGSPASSKGAATTRTATAATGTPAAAVAGHHPQASVLSLRQALLLKPKNERDRVIYSVLNKWVIEEEEEEP